jgi:hypothetical protein
MFSGVPWAFLTITGRISVYMVEEYENGPHQLQLQAEGVD